MKAKYTPTLIELMILVCIIGILSAIAIPAYFNSKPVTQDQIGDIRIWGQSDNCGEDKRWENLMKSCMTDNIIKQSEYDSLKNLCTVIGDEDRFKEFK